MTDIRNVSNVELGCGGNKRAGFFGIDIAPSPVVDLVMNIERDRLPFEDSSIDRIYSSHTFEHLEAPGSPIQTLREIIRVCKHLAQVEIWTPYGRSNDGLLFGHHVFYTETHWKHICFEYDDFYFGKGSPGRFTWRRTQYVLYPGILERLAELRIPIDFALTHMTNVVLEFGVFIEVDKSVSKALAPQFPAVELCYQRGQIVHRM